MKTKVITGCEMEYDDVGQGRAVVLLHAFPLARTMWRPQVDALKDDYRVIVPDLRGFGGTSPFEKIISIGLMADDVYALLEALRVDERVVLGGLSMGGYTALAFWRSYPTRVRALILADTRAEPDTDEGKANRDKMIEFAESHTPQEVIDQLLPKLLGEATRAQRPEVVEDVRHIASAQTIPAITGALRALRNRLDSRPALKEIVVPTLVMVGSEDTLTPPDVADTMAAAIKGAQKVVIEGAGHLSNLEQPEAFNEAVRSFVQALPEYP
jgi:pimeloyl-ACP methyl ester carboxylesterase